MGGGVLSRTSKGGGALTEAAFRRSALAQAAATRGPWKWAGEGPVLFYRSGRLYTPWGSGRWSLAGDSIAANLGPCGTYRLVFNKARTAFDASVGHLDPSSHGVLDSGDEAKDGATRTESTVDDEGVATDESDEAEVMAAINKWRRMSEDHIYKRLLGSGPWSWQGVSPLAFLGGGVLHTPWGRGSWEVNPAAGVNAIHANFVGQKHSVRGMRARTTSPPAAEGARRVRLPDPVCSAGSFCSPEMLAPCARACSQVVFDDCWGLVSTRESDGDKATGVAKIDPPPKADKCPKL